MSIHSVNTEWGNKLTLQRVQISEMMVKLGMVRVKKKSALNSSIIMRFQIRKKKIDPMTSHTDPCV